jgi:hypothetical protein
MAMTNVMSFALSLDYGREKALLAVPRRAKCPVVDTLLSADGE